MAKEAEVVSAAQLPLIGQPPVERADAARNRRKILDVARRMAAEYGVESLSMDDIARAAGVGVGTVYRRFGDRAGLVTALIDQNEQAFQAAFLQGSPPLGPGAAPQVRIAAFLTALVRRIEQQGAFMLVAETDTPLSRYSRPYILHHTHLTALLSEAAPGADAVYLADALLAPVAASLVTFQLQKRGMSVERITAGLEALLGRLLDEGPAPPDVGPD